MNNNYPKKAFFPNEDKLFNCLLFFFFSFITLLDLVGYFSFTVVVPTHGWMCSEEISGQMSQFLVWFYSMKDTVLVVQLLNLNPWTDYRRTFWCKILSQ